jgi:hypothetical protein
VIAAELAGKLAEVLELAGKLAEVLELAGKLAEVLELAPKFLQNAHVHPFPSCTHRSHCAVSYRVAIYIRAFIFRGIVGRGWFVYSWE